jgi:hypothetical protein
VNTGQTPGVRQPLARHPERPALRLVVLHDDREREFDYTAGAEDALQRAQDRGWTVASMRNDWTTVFPQS